MSNKEKIIAAAIKVLEKERDGVGALASDPPDGFPDAIELIANLKGRLIVTGMGKSGHVGAKIAATFASTGTPAFFVHPGEASHGDLGMITKEDAVLAISNSGETSELGDVLAHAKRFSIPLIGIASRPESRLLQAADIGLVLPKADEACPNGLAPTTSTTMTLALGDALAVALMDLRGFTADDYRVFHPGGALGAQLRPVSELMHAGEAMPLIGDDVTVRDAVLEMTSKSFGVTGIADKDGVLLGIITDGDLRRHLEQDGDGLLDRPAIDIMTASPTVIGKNNLVAAALGVMNDKSITSLFVVDGETSGDAIRPVGLIHMHDCLRAGFS